MIKAQKCSQEVDPFGSITILVGALLLFLLF